MSNFWDFMWLILSTFVFVAYLLILFQIVADLFRDPPTGGDGAFEVGGRVLYPAGCR
ncbi:MAG: rane protein [Proteobacteria bacterium]|nr:rane protein [Pseudomonadota bacterium]